MKLSSSLIVCCTLVVAFLCCKKDKPAPSAPIVVTVGLTAVTDSSAKAGGQITSTGNEEITATGFCWSTVNTAPTITDDTSVSFTTAATFVKEFKNLFPSTKYYVRAYAINSLGVGYGDVLELNTGNAPPKIDSIIVTGFPVIDSTLSAFYTYSDFENNRDSATVYQWYNALDTTGATDLAISGANDSIYKITLADSAKFVRVGVTPFSAAGSSPGKEVRSTWVGPVIP